MGYGQIANVKLHRHPILWVRQLVDSLIHDKKLSPDCRLQLSNYQYVPQSLKDSRITFERAPSLLDDNELMALIDSLKEGSELALHSKVISFGDVLHIPMIDFGYKGNSPQTSNVLKEFCAHWEMSFQIFSSGRSFHGYGTRLLKHDEWIQFMASLLLLNLPSGFRLIDERWIGHRLMAGYGSLRWSHNSHFYKKFPVHCGFISPNKIDIDMEID